MLNEMKYKDEILKAFEEINDGFVRFCMNLKHEILSCSNSAIESIQEE